MRCRRRATARRAVRAGRASSCRRPAEPRARRAALGERAAECGEGLGDRQVGERPVGHRSPGRGRAGERDRGRPAPGSSARATGRRRRSPRRRRAIRRRSSPRRWRRPRRRPGRTRTPGGVSSPSALTTRTIGVGEDEELLGQRAQERSCIVVVGGDDEVHTSVRAAELLEDADRRLQDPRALVRVRVEHDAREVERGQPLVELACLAAERARAGDRPAVSSPRRAILPIPDRARTQPMPAWRIVRHVHPIEHLRYVARARGGDPCRPGS